MANVPSNVATFELSPIDRAWIKKSLELQRASLIRSAAKELPGSDIAVLRGREIEVLTAMIGRF